MITTARSNCLNCAKMQRHQLGDTCWSHATIVSGSLKNENFDVEGNRELEDLPSEVRIQVIALATTVHLGALSGIVHINYLGYTVYSSIHQRGTHISWGVDSAAAGRNIARGMITRTRLTCHLNQLAEE